MILIIQNYNKISSDEHNRGCPVGQNYLIQFLHYNKVTV